MSQFLYLGTYSGVLALNSTDGSVSWSHSMGSAVTGAVTVDDQGFLYAAADAGKLAVSRM